MNTRLLRKVQKHILAEPRRLDMRKWAVKLTRRTKNAPPCGTVGCIAGWSCLLTKNLTFSEVYRGVQQPEGDIQERARELLGLDYGEAERLFIPYKVDYGAHWPQNFLGQYRRAKTPKQKAKVTSARIDHFIKTKGKE